MKLSSISTIFTLLILSILCFACSQDKKQDIDDKEIIITKREYTQHDFNKMAYLENIETSKTKPWLHLYRMPKNCDSVENIFQINLDLQTQKEVLAYEKKLNSELLIDGEKLHNIQQSRDPNIYFKNVDNIKIFKRKKRYNNTLFVAYNIEEKKVSEIIYSWGKAAIGSSNQIDTWLNKILTQLEPENGAITSYTLEAAVNDYMDVYDYLNCSSLEREILNEGPLDYKRKWKNGNDKITFNCTDLGTSIILDFRKNWYLEKKYKYVPQYIYDTIYIDKKTIE